MRRSELRTSTDCGDEIERRKGEQVLIFSCCIDKLQAHIKNMEDSKARVEMMNVMLMLILCRKALEG